MEDAVKNGTARRAWRAWYSGITLVVLALLPLTLSACGGSTGTSAGGSSNGSGSGGPVTPVAALGGGSFPTPREETFQSCPPPGDGGDSNLNLLKNRIDIGAWRPTALAELLALTWPPGVEKTARADWSTADAAQVARDEGAPVQVEGTLLMARHEGPESPNCHDQDQRDFHLWLAAAAGDSRANAMIVEVTPRVRAQHSAWQPDSEILGLAGQHVRISGWLLLDQEHPEQLHRTRGTLWEVHPVMRIEVDQGGRWVDLDGGSLRLQPTGYHGTTRSRRSRRSRRLSP